MRDSFRWKQLGQLECWSASWTRHWVGAGLDTLDEFVHGNLVHLYMVRMHIRTLATVFREVTMKETKVIHVLPVNASKEFHFSNNHDYSLSNC